MPILRGASGAVVNVTSVVEILTWVLPGTDVVEPPLTGGLEVVGAVIFGEDVVVDSPGILVVVVVLLGGIVGAPVVVDVLLELVELLGELVELVEDVLVVDVVSSLHGPK